MDYGIYLFLVLSTCVTMSFTMRQIKLMDNTPSNHQVVDLKSYDRYGEVLASDSGSNAKYNLLSPGKINQLFRLDSQSRLMTTQIIDREQLCGTSDLCCHKEDPCIMSLVVAMKSDNMPDPHIFEVQIELHDINDHSPQFPQSSVILSIKESDPVGTLYELPQPWDLDSLRYGLRSSELLSENGNGGPFQLDRQASGLRLVRALDRETTDRYQLTLQAVDKGIPARTGSISITVRVIDVNDNAPMLQRSSYIAIVRESELTAEPIVTIEATDADEAENARLYYRIVDEKKADEIEQTFRIDQMDGKIYLKQRLDYEKHQKYRFLVEVYNSGGIRDTTATATVQVNVLNLNDERPQITVNYLSGPGSTSKVITENELPTGPKGLFVALATVTDRDSGPDGRVHCSLTGHGGLFEVRKRDVSSAGGSRNNPGAAVASGGQRQQYTVFAKTALDREKMERYILSLTCEDEGVPALSNKAEIKVEVKDENDNAPTIDKASIESCSVRENEQANNLITVVRASDPDFGDNGKLRYSMASSDERVQSLLVLNPTTGELHTKAPIDRESMSPPLEELRVQLTVSDHGQPPRGPLSTSATFVVRIIDVNDNPPIFASELIQFKVSENNSPRHTLGEILVRDADGHRPQRQPLRVSLIPRPDSVNSPFVVFRHADKFYLNTTRSLDWEKEKNFSLSVIASDGQGSYSHTATARVLVQVEDENDHSPEIIFPNRNNGSIYSVSYKEPPGSAILSVSAIDQDSAQNQNGKFYFQLSITHPATTSGDKHDALFKIDQSTGKLTTCRMMRMDDIGKYQVSVVAEDYGNPPKNTAIFFTIEVKNSPPNSGGGHQNGGSAANQRESSDTDNGYHTDYRGTKSGGKYLWTREGLMVLSLIVLVLFLVMCVLLLLYMRHRRGMFPGLPDLLEGCCSCVRSRDSLQQHHRQQQQQQLPRNRQQQQQADMIAHKKAALALHNSPLLVHKYLRPNNQLDYDGHMSPLPFFQAQQRMANQQRFDTSHSTIPVNQLHSQQRQYETMSHPTYGTVMLPDCVYGGNSQADTVAANYDKLFYRPPNQQQHQILHTQQHPQLQHQQTVLSSESGFYQDSAVPKTPNSSVSCRRIINNISSMPSHTDPNEVVPCSPDDKPGSLLLSLPHHEQSPTAGNIDTYAVSFPKEQSTFV